MELSADTVTGILHLAHKINIQSERNTSLETYSMPLFFSMIVIKSVLETDFVEQNSSTQGILVLESLHFELLDPSE
jgi:hypothetical protein